MFINISNHSSLKWSPEQLAAAGEKVVDIQFPTIPPELDEQELIEFLCEWQQKNLSPILPEIDFIGDCKFVSPVTVHLMGEQGFCTLLAERLKNLGAVVVHSTTARDVVEKDGVKTSVFRFVRFRRTGFDN